jgi:dUTP pyrophosphatase
MFEEKKCNDIEKKAYKLGFSATKEDIESHVDNKLPNLEEELMWVFIRGNFDKNGVIDDINPICYITNNSKIDLHKFGEFCNIPYVLTKDKIVWKGINALDFLGKIYMKAKIYNTDKYNKFIYITKWRNKSSIPKFRFVKTCEESISPQKSRLSDTGYDLHIIKKLKEVNNVHFFDTGIKVQLDYGYYFDLVGRSSISKTGWMLANNIGIIDQGYSGSIIVALVPTRDNPPPLELPMKLVQLIPRKVIIVEPEEVSFLDETNRGDTGGLCSSQF